MAYAKLSVNPDQAVGNGIVKLFAWCVLPGLVGWAIAATIQGPNRKSPIEGHRARGGWLYHRFSLAAEPCAKRVEELWLPTSVWWSPYKNDPGGLVCQVRGRPERTPNRVCRRRRPPPAPPAREDNNGNLDRRSSVNQRHHHYLWRGGVDQQKRRSVPPDILVCKSRPAATAVAGPSGFFFSFFFFFSANCSRVCRYVCRGVIVHRASWPAIHRTHREVFVCAVVTSRAARK